MAQAVATTAAHQIAPARRCAHMAFVPYRTGRLFGARARHVANSHGYWRKGD